MIMCLGFILAYLTVRHIKEFEENEFDVFNPFVFLKL